MLNGVHLVNFGNHRGTRLAFGSISALVGQNASGKTTVMRAIRAIQTPLSEGVHGTIDKTHIRRGYQSVSVAASRQDYSSEKGSDFGVIVSQGGGFLFSPCSRKRWEAVAARSHQSGRTGANRRKSTKGSMELQIF